MSMTTKEMIEVLQAADAGQPIQYRHSGCQWEDKTESESWAFDIREFRIKPTPPKPRDFWICYTDDPTYSGSYIYGVKQNEPLHAPRKQIHVREVLPEEETP